MSQQEKAYTAILLPAAKVTLFTGDGDTRKAFEALEKDWRFARVELTVNAGTVDTAINHYQSAPSPDLVIVQTDNIDDGFSEKLEALGGSCSEGTSAIVIGPVNDVNLYRKLVGMGVSDYLVRPVTTESLSEDIAATLLNKIGAADSRLIALLGVKGGVGVTVLSESLAWGIAEKLGQKTFLLDAASGWSTLSVGMDFEPTTTLAEAVRAANDRNEDSLTRMMYSPHEKLTVLSSGGDVMLDDLVTPEGYEALLDMLMTTYPVVIVDLSASPPALIHTVVKRAHQTLLVATPTLPAIRAARTLLSEIKQLRGGSVNEVQIIVNKQGMLPKTEVAKAQIEEGLDRDDLIYLPFEPELFMSIESEARKLTDEKEGAAIIDKLLALAGKVISAEVNVEEGEKKGGLGQLLTKLRARS